MTAAPSGALRVRGAAHDEAVVAAELNDRGWHAEPYGQALLSPMARDALIRYRDEDDRKALLRWLPDLLVYNDERLPSMFLVDVKRTSPSIAIEDDSCRAANDNIARLGIPVVYVCSPSFELPANRWRVLLPSIMRDHGKPGSFRGNGSGTPFHTIGWRFAAPLDAHFPVLR